jgi:hypothetical protein
VVTVAQLKAERRLAFRRTRTSLNKVRKSLNYLHRQLDSRLEGHYTELIDNKDAQKVIDSAGQMDVLWNDFKRSVLDNLLVFLR